MVKEKMVLLLLSGSRLPILFLGSFDGEVFLVYQEFIHPIIQLFRLFIFSFCVQSSIVINNSQDLLTESYFNNHFYKEFSMNHLI